MHRLQIETKQIEIFRYFYNFCLGLAWPVLLLYYAVRARKGGKYSRNCRSRMGLEMPPDMPEACGGGRIWVHALSVGETLSAVPLVDALRRRFPDAEIVFSTATETGRDIARKRLSPLVSLLFFLPHDFPWAMRSIVRRLKPSAFILVETDLWPNLLYALERRGIPAFLANGRLSPGSFRRLRHARPLARDLLSRFQLIFAQSEADSERYGVLGVPKSSIRTEGNLKFDAAAVTPSPSMVGKLREETGIGEGRLAWIGGSTHEGEEEILLEVHAGLRKRYPDLLLILAPRQVGRSPEILSLCRRYGLPVASRSSRSPAGEAAVFLVDTLGELVYFYSFACIAFIGGSLVPFGGHNPLEAAAQGKPAIWGPHLFNFREIEEGLLKAGCGRKVSSREELETVVNGFVADPGVRSRMGRETADFFAAHTGCGTKIAVSLDPILSHRVNEGKDSA